MSPTNKERRAFEQEGLALWEELRQEWKGQCNVLYYSEERGRLFEDPEEYQSHV